MNNEPSFTLSQRVWRALAGAACFWIGYRMFLNGRHPTWNVVERWAWAIVAVLLFVGGIFGFFQAIPSVKGAPEPRWFPDRDSGRPFVGVLGVALMIFLTVLGTEALRPNLTGRAAIAGIGVLFTYLAVTRSPVLWDGPAGPVFGTVTNMREFFGDTAVQLFFIAVGLGFIAIGIFAEM